MQSFRSALLLELPRQEYREMCRVQETLHHKRQRNEIPDVVILLEHTPCITIGSGGGYHNILADQATLTNNGISVHSTSRGGNITYHGPGQLVCYPILALNGEERDLHAYARRIEEVMIQTVQRFGIQAGRKAKYPGVWVQDAKIGAMGIAVRKWTTMHGISLNVSPNLRHFGYIVPCGIANHRVTSMEQILGKQVEMIAVRGEFCHQFSQIFKVSLQSGRLEEFIKEDVCETA